MEGIADELARIGTDVATSDILHDIGVPIKHCTALLREGCHRGSKIICAELLDSADFIGIAQIL